MKPTFTRCGQLIDGFDENDIEIPEANQTCTACHSNRDTNNAVQVPAAQPNLADGYSAEVPGQTPVPPGAAGGRQ